MYILARGGEGGRREGEGGGDMCKGQGDAFIDNNMICNFIYYPKYTYVLEIFTHYILFIIL